MRNVNNNIDMDIGEYDPNISELSTFDNTSWANESTGEEGRFLHKLFGEHENIFLVNAASLRYKINDLLIEAIDMDTLCVCETWLHDGIASKDLRINGFHLPERKDRASDAHGSVCVYVKNTLRYIRRRDLEDNRLESIWLEIWWGTEKTLLCCTYRPPNSPTEVWEHIQGNIEHARDTSELPIIYCGDMNCDVSTKPNVLESVILKCGLYIVNKEPTHVSSTNATTIDIFAMSKPGSMAAINNTSPSLSNHDGVVLSLGYYKQAKGEYSRKIYDYSKTDWLGLNEAIRTYKWMQITDDSDVNIVAEHWCENYKKLIEKFVNV